ncbi:hypothetical protein JCM33374_g5963 [Metschnikowia sp. JCM 33374]|nr:hypothetical protein JCM33374_g5963 [Metschnikowia sp. JCM 33374]
MSTALINRSLTTIRTELEFLYDSEVIDKPLFDKLMDALPRKYAKDMAPWGMDKLTGASGADGPQKGGVNAERPGPPSSAADSIANSLKKTSLRDDLSPPPHPPVAAPLPERSPPSALGYCKVSYNYESSESGDLKLAKGDLLAVLEHLSPDWWKGYKKGSGPAQAGVFPSNYVVVVSETEFNASSAPEKRPAPVPERSSDQSEKSSYEPQNNSSVAAPPMYQQAQHSSNSEYQPGYQQGYQQGPPHAYQQGYSVQPQPQQQPSYGGYAQYPPPSTNYYGQQQMQPQQQPYQQEQQAAPQGSNGAGHFKKFGSKLGNAAIFGAGATIGGDIVNSIF